MSSINSTSAPSVIAGEARTGGGPAPGSATAAEAGNGRIAVSTVVRHGVSKPVKNFRITFWGVQGSCPLFPEPHEVEGYKDQVCRYALTHILNDMKARTSNGQVRIQDLLGGPIDASTIEAYLHKVAIPDLPVYGGETTCISIETGDGHTILIDGGSGIRHCSKYLIPAWGDRPRTIDIFGTHEHLDHRSGLPFCQFCYTRPPFALNVYGTRQFLDALDSRYGVFCHKLNDQMHFDDPVDFRMMSASFRATEMRSLDENDRISGNDADLPWKIHDMHEPILIGQTRVTAFDVYHGPTRCLSYKFEHNGVTFLFSTDHEIRHTDNVDDPRQFKSFAAEVRLREHSLNADVAYYDGQYRLDEYMGRAKISSTSAVPRIDWGHGCIEDIIERSRLCNVKRTFIGHHDPERDWQDRMRIDRELLEQGRRTGVPIELAKSDLVLDL